MTEPIISFTFDDFPSTALDVAGPRLQAYGWQGTFYMAMGLSGTDQEVGRIATPENLARAWQAGHEIGSHSFEHLDFSTASQRLILQDIEKNQLALGENASRNFAYPMGRTSALAKWRTGQMMDSARGTRPGLNLERTDLNCLRAYPIYSHRGLQTPLDAIKQVISEKGWLIFYTHDISESPSQFGCTPEDFEEILKTVDSAGISVLKVEDALRELTNGHRQE